MRPYKMAYIRELLKQVPHFFVSYLAGLQVEMTNPKCLTQAIPEIAELNERLKYLEEEVSMHEILSQKSKIEKIFNKLKNIKQIKIDCEKKTSRPPAKKKPVLKF
jgi:hypothetical protein